MNVSYKFVSFYIAIFFLRISISPIEVILYDDLNNILGCLFLTNHLCFLKTMFFGTTRWDVEYVSSTFLDQLMP